MCIRDRVEAVVGQGVIAMLQERDALIAHAAAAIKAAPVELVHLSLIHISFWALWWPAFCSAT